MNIRFINQITNISSTEANVSLFQFNRKKKNSKWLCCVRLVQSFCDKNWYFYRIVIFDLICRPHTHTLIRHTELIRFAWNQLYDQIDQQVVESYKLNGIQNTGQNIYTNKSV